MKMSEAERMIILVVLDNHVLIHENFIGLAAVEDSILEQNVLGQCFFMQARRIQSTHKKNSKKTVQESLSF